MQHSCVLLVSYQLHERLVGLLVIVHYMVVPSICLSFLHAPWRNSNFNVANWEPRSNDLHRIFASRYQECKTKSQQKEVEREYGIRYSVLLELPYFDASRICIIDPMHKSSIGNCQAYDSDLEGIGFIK